MVTLRKGLPRFVVFIMCDEDAGESSAIVKKEKEKDMQKKGKRKKDEDKQDEQDEPEGGEEGKA